MKNIVRIALVGAAAGAVNGLFGAGGGMVLVPLLTWAADLEENAVFPASVSIIFPICLISLAINVCQNGLPLSIALPYLLGALGGGVLAGITEQKIPVKWLHRFLGILILWGGYRYLC